MSFLDNIPCVTRTFGVDDRIHVSFSHQIIDARCSVDSAAYSDSHSRELLTTREPLNRSDTGVVPFKAGFE